jgi:hypothetical protein
MKFPRVTLVAVLGLAVAWSSHAAETPPAQQPETAGTGAAQA